MLQHDVMKIVKQCGKRHYIDTSWSIQDELEPRNVVQLKTPPPTSLKDTTLDIKRYGEYYEMTKFSP